jgi:hypothetical protein
LVAKYHGLVADTGFPVGKALEGKIISPLKQPEKDMAGLMPPADRDRILGRSSIITQLRQACEWGMGSISHVFRHLKMPLTWDQKTRALRLKNIFRLWNYRVRTTGITQIGTFFDS